MTAKYNDGDFIIYISDGSHYSGTIVYSYVLQTIAQPNTYKYQVQNDEGDRTIVNEHYIVPFDMSELLSI